MEDVGRGRGRQRESRVNKAARDSNEDLFVGGDPRGSYELANGSMVCCYTALGLNDQVSSGLVVIRSGSPDNRSARDFSLQGTRGRSCERVKVRVMNGNANEDIQVRTYS